MEKQQKKQVKKYISWVLIAAITATLAFLPMIAAGEEPETGPQASILSAEAENRDISRNVLGGGTLTAEAAAAITIPAAVKVKEYLVTNGDMVTEGQPIALVDRVSIMSAITQVQETMDHLQERLDDVSGDTAPDAITATAGGTVKIVYGAKGESVQDVILRDGALAVLSLDGLMAVQITRSTDLSGGDLVCVTLSDGTEVTGKVESNLEGILTVTVTDEGYAVGETVTITTEDGARIGSGSLYIHSQWNVVAYSGRISRVRVSEGDAVKAGKTLFELVDTGHTAEFESLARQHREYEALMMELFKMYQSEAVTATRGGIVTGVDESGAYMLSTDAAGWTLSLLLNAPNGDDETGYVNYIGQVAQVGIDGLILKMNPQSLAVTDYKDLSDVPLDASLMTEDAIYTASAPIYELSDGEWVQIEAASIAAGDILLFAGDSEGNFVWVVRVAGETAQPEIPEGSAPTEPSEPTQPSEPTMPAEPESPDESTDVTEPTNPTEPSGSAGVTRPQGNLPQGGINMPGFGGGMPQEETFELYGLDTVTIASVIPQEQVSVQIVVDELDITQIHVGQTAAVTVDALPGENFCGQVTSVSGTGESEGGNSKFTVEVTLKKETNMLPGMNAAVSLTVETAENALCIPVAALMEDGTQTYVYTGYDEEAGKFVNPVAVTVGASDGEYVQILSGISYGQTVCHPYYDTLVITNAPEMSGGFRFG